MSFVPKMNKYIMTRNNFITHNDLSKLIIMINTVLENNNIDYTYDNFRWFFNDDYIYIFSSSVKNTHIVTSTNRHIINIIK